MAKKVDNVNQPHHYNIGNIPVIDFIDDKELGFNDGNVVKYVVRSPHKGRTIEDLEKAEWYLKRHIKNVKKKLKKQKPTKKKPVKKKLVKKKLVKKKSTKKKQ